MVGTLEVRGLQRELPVGAGKQGTLWCRPPLLGKRFVGGLRVRL